MSERIDLAQLRSDFEDGYFGPDWDATLLALVDAVEAAFRFQARALASPTGYDRPDAVLAATENELWAALARFTFADPVQKPVDGGDNRLRRLRRVL